MKIETQWLKCPVCAVENEATPYEEWHFECGWCGTPYDMGFCDTCGARIGTHFGDGCVCPVCFGLHTK